MIQLQSLMRHWRTNVKLAYSNDYSIVVTRQELFLGSLCSLCTINDDMNYFTIFGQIS